jgi:hypothetical protein
VRSVQTFAARSPEELQEIAGVTHDARFNGREAVVFDEGAAQLTISFEQEGGAWCGGPEPELVRETWRYREYRVPLLRGRLIIRRVLAVRNLDEWGDMEMLVGIDYNRRHGEVRVYADGALRVQVSAVDVVATITDEVAGALRRRNRKLTRVQSDKSGRTPP